MSLRGQTLPLSIAPMMQRTDTHYRVMARQFSRRCLLYTEMVTTWAILHGPTEQLLEFDPIEHPISLQVGGDDPLQLAQCARIAEDFGFDEININIGCPSDRVQSGSFGACLMARPERVAEGVTAMRAACTIPVTVKHRIGIDDLDRYEDMANFVEVVSRAEADRFSVHARKAWLQGLSPKENRTIPPLRYPEVHRLKQDFPDLPIEINGGIRTLDEAEAQLKKVDAVMIGRAAWDDPMMLRTADSRLFGDPDPKITDAELVETMTAHAARWMDAADHHRMITIVRPLLQLFWGQPGARRWRRNLSTSAQDRSAGPEIIRAAWESMGRE
jgi:tRNA-dihydrouridine synthase A